MEHKQTAQGAGNTISIDTLIASNSFQNDKSKLPFTLGKTPDGQDIVADIASLRHLLIAGSPGAAVSAYIHTLLLSLLYKANPREIRLILLDSQNKELSLYNGIPHLLFPVVTDFQEAIGVLQWAADEGMGRLGRISEAGVNRLEEYNFLALERGDGEKMPYIVVVIEELASLMNPAAKETEELICRIARMGHNVGIHLVIATQHPSADVVTGFIKFHIPGRIAFRVTCAAESRIILDTRGAEELTGQHDILCAFPGKSRPTRIQGCFATPHDVRSVVSFLQKN